MSGDVCGGPSITVLSGPASRSSAVSRCHPGRRRGAPSCWHGVPEPSASPPRGVGPSALSTRPGMRYGGERRCEVDVPAQRAGVCAVWESRSAHEERDPCVSVVGRLLARRKSVRTEVESVVGGEDDGGVAKNGCPARTESSMNTEREARARADQPAWVKRTFSESAGARDAAPKPGLQGARGGAWGRADILARIRHAGRRSIRRARRTCGGGGGSRLDGWTRTPKSYNGPQALSSTRRPTGVVARSRAVRSPPCLAPLPR